MNDRFKFRVWDRINDKWLSNKNCIEIGTGYLTDFLDVEQAFNRRYVLMQSTGLKDKNGKLIFEGDIVRFAQYEIEDIEPDWEYTEVIWGGEDKYPAFDLKYQCFDSNGLSWIFNENYIIEVVGNIYENKDLLNA